LTDQSKVSNPAPVPPVTVIKSLRTAPAPPAGPFVTLTRSVVALEKRLSVIASRLTEAFTCVDVEREPLLPQVSEVVAVVVPVAPPPGQDEKMTMSEAEADDRATTNTATTPTITLAIRPGNAEKQHVYRNRIGYSLN
jgi:hypothetical protein